jgi:hypothetical protein
MAPVTCRTRNARGNDISPPSPTTNGLSYEPATGHDSPLAAVSDFTLKSVRISWGCVFWLALSLHPLHLSLHDEVDKSSFAYLDILLGHIQLSH